MYDLLIVQYGDVVFDEYDMLSSMGTYTANSIVNSTDYKYKGGAYTPFKNDKLFYKPFSISTTIRLNLKKIQCNDRYRYLDYVKIQLNKPDKLWFVKGDRLLYANSYVESFSEERTSLSGRVEIDVTFKVYEGYFHIADTYKTYISSFSYCDNMECLNIKTKPLCKDWDCCNDFNLYYNNGNKDKADCTCCCDLDNSQKLCYNISVLSEYYNNSCDDRYKISYDCKAEGYSQKVNNYGVVYNYGTLETDGYKIVIDNYKNKAEITVNGNMNIVNYEGEGKLEIYSNGEVYLNGCLLPINSTIIPSGYLYGFKFKQGNNKVTIKTMHDNTISYIYLDERYI